MARNLRSVVFEPQFERELRAIESDPRRADEAIAGAVWTLARSAEIGAPVRPGSPVRILRLRPQPTFPAVMIPSRE